MQSVGPTKTDLGSTWLEMLVFSDLTMATGPMANTVREGPWLVYGERTLEYLRRTLWTHQQPKIAVHYLNAGSLGDCQNYLK